MGNLHYRKISVSPYVLDVVRLFKELMTVLGFAKELFLEFKSLQADILVSSPSRTQVSSKWCPPVLDCFKFNVDVAFGLESSVEVGAVLRDCSVCVRACFILLRTSFFSAEIGELLAIRESVLLV
ncbi:hypothetical protein Q3G72_010070 [Acer saccharum]|nr:hypothetical protein Q3G72_010070 [Acer saccharum]